jgi:hypothetical protein
VQVLAEVTDSGGGIHGCRISRNREVVKFVGDSPPKSLSLRIDEQVTLVPGENELEVSCFDRSGNGSARASTIVSAKGTSNRPRIAYVLGIGIDAYKEDKLRYAVSDAELFLSSMKESLLATTNYDRVVDLPLLDPLATRDNIVAVLSKLAGKVPQAGSSALPLLDKVNTVGPQDAVVLYFAGHGGMNGERYQLYTFAHDASLDSAGLTDKDLGSLFADINARDLLIVLDSCESGGALGSQEQLIGPFNSTSFAQMAYDKGIFVLVASQASAAAREPPELKHGLLTHILINDGLLAGKAFTASEGTRLSVRDFIDYPLHGVPEWQAEERSKQIQGSAGAGGQESIRLVMVGNKPLSSAQIPRSFVPYFGYNANFSVAGPRAPAH